MKVIELLEANPVINSITDLKNAFTVEEWEAITCYYVSTEDTGPSTIVSRTLNDNNPTALAASARRFRETIGRDMPASTTPAGWATDAMRFNIQTTGIVSWQGVYNEYAKHKDHECALDLSSEAPGIDRSTVTGFGTTPETVQTLAGFGSSVQVPDPITDGEDLYRYFQAIIVGIKNTPARTEPNERGRSWLQWYESPSTQFSDNSEYRPLKDMAMDMFLRYADTQGTGDNMVFAIRDQYPNGVSKNQFLGSILAWLQVTDDIVARQEALLASQNQ